MKITAIETVYQIAFLPRVFPVNCYFVHEDDGLTLIDTALPYSYKGILEAAGNIGEPIKRIVLTHAHGDHVGSLVKLKNEIPDASIFISSRDARLLSGDCSLDPDEPNTPIRGGIPKNINLKPDTVLNDGDRVESLLAIHVPGHTPGSMAFLDTRNNILIAGDAFHTRGGLTVSGHLRVLFPFPAMATWNKHLALKSAQKLSDMHPSLLAVGHGPMVRDPQSSMIRAIETAESILKKRGGA